MGSDRHGHSFIGAKLKPAVPGIPGSGIRKDDMQGTLSLTLEVSSMPLSERLFYPPTTSCLISLPRFSKPESDGATNWWHNLNPKDIKANQTRAAAWISP